MFDPTANHDDPATWPWANRSAFAGWLYSQHARDDRLGRLASALRADPDDPNPANGNELSCYLTFAGASAEMHAAGRYAWGFYLAEMYPVFVIGLLDSVDPTEVDEPGFVRWMTISELLEEVDWQGARVPPAHELAATLSGLAPFLMASADIGIRVEGEQFALTHSPGLNSTCHPRYSGTQENG